MGTKNIWDGKDLPPIGSQVLIKLASALSLTMHNVIGYEVRKPVDADRVKYPHWLYVVVIKVERNGCKNERFLSEVYPLDHRDD